MNKNYYINIRGVVQYDGKPTRTITLRFWEAEDSNNSIEQNIENGNYTLHNI